MYDEQCRVLLEEEATRGALIQPTEGVLRIRKLFAHRRKQLLNTGVVEFTACS